VTVTDPTHPLFDRTFCVVSRHRRRDAAVSLEVELRDGILIRIPVAATDRGYCPTPSTGTRITAVALRQLIAIAREGEAPCSSDLAPSGDDSPKPSGNTSSAS
jgi:hypothetical protein